MHKQDSRYFLLPYTECQRCIILFVITSTQLFTWFGSVNHNNIKSTHLTLKAPWKPNSAMKLSTGLGGGVLVQNIKDAKIGGKLMLPCAQNDQNDQCDGCKVHGYLGDHNL